MATTTAALFVCVHATDQSFVRLPPTLTSAATGEELARAVLADPHFSLVGAPLNALSLRFVGHSEPDIDACTAALPRLKATESLRSVVGFDASAPRAFLCACVARRLVPEHLVMPAAAVAGAAAVAAASIAPAAAAGISAAAPPVLHVHPLSAGAAPAASAAAPFAPHLAEEIWSRLGFSGLASKQPWPTHDVSLLVENEVELAVQVNGKVRERLVISKDATKEEIEKAALASEKVREATAGQSIVKVVVVPGKLVNIVAK
jgi:hypothetical protein